MSRCQLTGLHHTMGQMMWTTHFCSADNKQILICMFCPPILFSTYVYDMLFGKSLSLVHLMLYKYKLQFNCLLLNSKATVQKKENSLGDGSWVWEVCAVSCSITLINVSFLYVYKLKLRVTHNSPWMLCSWSFPFGGFYSFLHLSAHILMYFMH